MRNQSAFKSSFAAVAFNSESQECIKKTKQTAGSYLPV